MNYTKELRDFIELTTVEDGNERIDIELLRDHPFLKKHVNAQEKVLYYKQEDFISRKKRF